MEAAKKRGEGVSKETKKGLNLTSIQSRMSEIGRSVKEQVLTTRAVTRIKLNRDMNPANFSLMPIAAKVKEHASPNPTSYFSNLRKVKFREGKLSR